MNINIDYKQIMTKALSICIITIATVMVVTSVYNYHQSDQKIIVFENNATDTALLRIADKYGIEGQKSLSEFFSEDASLYRMQEFSLFLNEDFNYLEFDTQKLLLKSDFNYKDEFREDYGSSIYGANDHIGVSLKSIQINETAYNNFNLNNKVMAGDGFKDSDYIFTVAKPIPAILGYEYSDLINLGDKVGFNYLSKDVYIQVAGFFDKNTMMAVNNETYFLDRYIVIPSLIINEASLKKEDLSFAQILYSLKNWGYIKVSEGEDYFKYKNKIDEMSKKLDICYIVNESSISEHIKNISSTINSNKGFFLIASIMLYLILSAACVAIFVWSYNKNKKAYAIHLICGSSLLQIKGKIFFDIIAQFILSFCIAAYLFTITSSFNSNYISDAILLNKAVIQTIRLAFLIMAVILLIINRYINKSDVYTDIRKDR